MPRAKAVPAQATDETAPPDFQPPIQQTNPELMIEAAGMRPDFERLTEFAQRQLDVLKGVEGGTAREDRQTIREGVRNLYKTIKEFDSVRAQVLSDADDKKFETQELFNTWINALKRTRFGLQSALLK